MFLKDAIRSNGLAVRHDEDGTIHLCMNYHPVLWLILGRGDVLQVAARGGKTIAGVDWEKAAPDDPAIVALLEQFHRPVQRVGRICDILVEGEPGIVELPGGKTLVRFDGKKFAMDVALDEFSLFDRGWKLRDGKQKLRLVE